MRLRVSGSFVYVAEMNRVAINKEESRAETLGAFIASLAIHLFLILAVAYFLLSSRVEPPPKPMEEEPLQITIIQPSVPKPVKVTPKYISAVPHAPAHSKPKTDAAFESDKDSVAASEAAPSGREAAPSLDGKEDKNIELQNQQYTEGKKEERSAPPQQQAEKQTEKREVTAAAEPAPTPRADPELALIEKPRPKPAQVVKKTTPAQKSSTPSASGFQPETRVTRLRGSISNRGRASVEANATPLGRYKKAVSDAIGSRWYYYVKSQMGLLNIGTVDIRFTILPNGKVKAPQILNNTSNESFASVSLSAIVQAEIPPIPPEVEAVLENGRIEIDYSFSILGN
jgi:outer membrane biosynthesis protein TonB